MALTDQNIRLMASEILSDVDEAGGRMSGNEVVDGVSNNLFPDVSELDRTIGRVNLRKAYPAVLADNTDCYYGVNVIIDQVPTDPNVSVAMFSTKSWDDERSDASSRMESYLARGPRFDGYLWDQHITGQKALQLLSYPDREDLASGATLVVVKDPGLSTEQTQFVRVTKVESEIREFTTQGSCGTFSLKVMTCYISDALLFDVMGGTASCDFVAGEYGIVGTTYTINTSTTLPQSRLYTTIVADAAKYAGMTRLAKSASLGDFTITADSIFTQLVPSAQIESAITDARPHSDSALAISAGNTVTFSGSYAFGATQNLYLGQAITPGTLSMTMGGTALTDLAGKLMAGTTQIGLVDYANGILSRFDATATVSISASFKPAAFPVRNMQTAAWDVTIESRSQTIVFILDPIPTPGSLSISFMSQGKWYTLRDDYSGALRGSDSSYGSGIVNFTTGSVVVTLGALPDVGSSVMAVWGTKSIDTVRNAIPVKAGMDISLANQGIAPNSVSITWTDGVTTKTATDDGLGVLTGDATGTVSYARGTVHIEPNIMPPGGTVFTVGYNWGAPIEESFAHPLRDANGKLSITLANPLILEKSVEVEWNLLIDKNAAASDYYYATSSFVPAPGGDRLIIWSDPIEIERDDGAGHFIEDALAVVDYSAGSLTWNPDRIVKIPVPEYTNTVTGTETTTTVGGTTTTTSYHHHLSGFRYVDAPAIYPSDESGYVKIRYRTAAAGNTASEPFTFVPQLDATPGYAENIIPGSVTLTHGGKTMIDRQAKLYTDIDRSTGAGTEVGTIDYTTGAITLTAWTNAATNGGQIDGMITTLGSTPVDEVTFRTASAPLRPGSLILQVVFCGTGDIVTVTADTSGVITGTNVTGKVDYQTGIVRVRFGRWVSETAPETYFPTGQTTTRAPWFTTEAVVGGQIFFSQPVLADTLRYAAVAYSYIPLDKDILGVDPVRLPTDGRVPIFRAGDVAVVHHTATVNTASLSVPQTINLGRTRLSRVWLFDEGNADIRVPTTHYTADLDAGTVTLTSATGLIGPLRIEHRIEDMALLSDVQINGQLTMTRPLSHDYPAMETGVSSALVIGDLQARATRVFDQQTWTNEWSDDLIGSATSAEYNDTIYPIEVTNEGAAQDRWALIFNSPTEVRVIGESAGQIATLSIANEIAPLNPATNKPYFRINPLGWGAGWSTGNVLRFNTVAANYPVWIARTVKQGPGINGGDKFRIQIRGDANA